MNKEPSSAGGDQAMDAVSRRLREYYDAVKEEAIPDRLLDLLEKLDEADRSQRPVSSDGRKE
ncbi:MAG: NepR family anti-sigma factor [Rhizobiaceae bacterium]